MMAEKCRWPSLIEYLGLDQRIWRDPQSPLVLGWSDKQLRPIVDAIDPLLSPHLTDEVRLTAASIMRSVVTQHLQTGRATYYSRSRDFFQPSRYRDDPRYTYYYV